MTEDRQVVTDAYMWWCQDDVCDCTQYRIERRTPRPYPNRFFDIELIWEGEFWTDGTGRFGDHTDEDNAARLQAFRDAAEAAGIELVKDRFGHWSGRVLERVGTSVGTKPTKGDPLTT